MQTYVAQNGHRQLPPAQEHGVQTDQRITATPAPAGAQMQMGEMLNQTARVQSLVQIKQMLHDSPRMASQRARQRTLNPGFGQAAIQREAMAGEQELTQAKFEPAQRSEQNRTGLPDNLKAGVEALSGLSLGDVRVHYNSPHPAQLSALAFAQGTDIHVSPGQEQHLPHEAWHVVQQKQGRVTPTLQLQGTAINDETGLEREADLYGARALVVDADGAPAAQRAATSQLRGPVVQCNGFSWGYASNDTLWGLNQAQYAINVARQNVPYSGNITSDIDATRGESTARLGVARHILSNTFGGWEQGWGASPNAFNRAAAAACAQGGACNEFSALTHSALITRGQTTQPIVRVWDPHAHHSFTMIGDPRQTPANEIAVADAWVPRNQPATLADTRWQSEISPGHLEVHTQTPLLGPLEAQQNLFDYSASYYQASPASLPIYDVNNPASRTAGLNDPRGGRPVNESRDDFYNRVRTDPGFAFGNQWSTHNENPYYYYPYNYVPSYYPYAHAW
jgi:hypothetical protein